MKSNQDKQPLKYVRVRNVIREKFVEFDFAINDPLLYVELILPVDAYDVFCEKNQVIEMTKEQCDAIDAETEKWRYGTDTLASHNRDASIHEIESGS